MVWAGGVSGDAAQPPASPDIIGISSGASAAAVFAIISLSLNGPVVSVIAVTGGLGVALLIRLLAGRGGAAGTRLILVGIGMAAMLNSFIAYILSSAPAWDLQEATRWLIGSVDGARPAQVLPVALGLVVLGGMLLSRNRDLETLRLGEDTAAALGTRTGGLRVTVILCAVGMIAIATAVAGPICFVAFLSGPIAARIIGNSGPVLIPAALTGALLVLVGDYCGQFLLPGRYPVGIVTWRPGRALPDLSHHPGEPDRRLVMNPHQLSARRLSAGYGDRAIISGLDLDILPGEITVIVGPNACGKSTLLRTMSRLLRPQWRAGVAGREIRPCHGPARAGLGTLGLLPQSPVAPEGITVSDLVSRGRHPHHGMLSRWTTRDDEAVAEALQATQTLDLAERPVDELSGGQRQRVWIAMALAQQTHLLLLDEPTTFLDITHQVEVLDLLCDLNAARGTTIVMVLHDPDLAARYADRLIVMAAGQIEAAGTAEEALTQDNLHRVFGPDSRIITDPTSGRPIMPPIGRHRMAGGTG
ncbi:iron chelate uptake ABC transporter family permease subunit [Paracoccus sp. DMF-8]|uniref:iron chelate uptake ABC transporter family permease subunit n=1 Tax=Paracoccus sp. DMF-8 TaxID=3019445 RepID=UPI0023E8AC5D|nr:iron chelate uptake ABC transporter family permease subunit [Paracoccus sp. DMF-8]MDF3604717.1 iron chelate uptake ABC transporter family permease subunit [Paracoccus sp. DMF-8]